MSTMKTALSVEIREVPPQPYLGKRFRAPLTDVGSRVQAGFADLYHRLSATGTAASGPPFLIAGFPSNGHLEVVLGAPCSGAPPSGDGFEAGTLPGGRVAVTVHRGPYETVGAVYPRLAEWIAANGLVTAGPPREVYLTPPGEEPVTEIAWPLA